MLPSIADDVLPKKSSDINFDAIGLYQVPLKFSVYQMPDKKADIIYRANWDYKTFNSSNDQTADDLFTVLIQEKELAYVQVTDYIEDWVEIIYDKSNHKKGWIPSEDLRFMTWRSFYNMYGRKYGLYYFANVQNDSKKMYSSTDEESQIIGQINKPLKIKLTVIKGNWGLVTSVENNNGKSGYIRWRNDNGEIYLFPAIK